MITMMVVDDEAWVRERLIHTIDWELHGIEVIEEASCGEEALDKVLRLHPDIILTDIRMPNMGGLELIQALRDELLPSKVIIISGYSDFDYAKKAISLGAFDYILKPVEDHDLLQVVHKCLDQVRIDKKKEELLQKADILLHRKTQSKKKRKIIEKIVAYMEEHYNESINLNTVAEVFLMNASYLSKIFKEDMDVSFSKFVMEYRVEKAIELMKDPTRKIYEIASCVGYEDVQYFTKLFKSIKGVTPVQYREMVT